MKKITTFLALVLFTACASSAPKKVTASASDGWYGDNEKKLQAMIKAEGKQSKKYDPAHQPVATFDWDNTVLKNDGGDATFFWMLTHDLIKTPKSWSKTSRFLTEKAVHTLAQTCGTQHPGSPLITHLGDPCADLLLSIYDDSKLPKNMGGDYAWKLDFNLDALNPAYAWFGSLLAGYRPEAVRKFTADALAENLAHPPGTKQKIGAKDVVNWVRYYSQQKALIHELQENGFDVWIVSASPQAVVEVYAAGVDVPADHVIGIRSLTNKQGAYTADLEGCGTYPDHSNAIITFRQGKRCFINKVIFAEKDPKAMLDKRSGTTFAAGDSETDVFFVRDAKYHLVINRNYTELKLAD
jgi:phosphoserine phosphatase